MVAYLCLFTQLNFIASKMADLTNLFDKTTCLIRPFCSAGRGGLIREGLLYCSILIDLMWFLNGVLVGLMHGFFI